MGTNILKSLQQCNDGNDSSKEGSQVITHSGSPVKVSERLDIPLI